MTIKDIEGAGGKGGGGGGATQAKTTIQTTDIVRVLELLSEGEIVGVVGGLKGVYLNDTPVQNADDSLNFTGVSYDERFGLPDQSYMSGFPSAVDIVTVAVAVTKASPAVKSVSSNAVDAVKLTVLFPAGLSKQDTGNGSISGHTVTFAIETQRPGETTWNTTGADIVINDMAPKSFEKDYYIPRPSGTGIWSIRLRRISDDDANSSVRSLITFSRIAEIQDVKLTYDNCAYIGVAIDSQSVGNSIPRRSYLVKGMKVQVPDNYNTVTRMYSGNWGGIFKTEWTDNPAWVIYDLITNERYGMGEFITADQVDKFSFYDAARYNDEFVPDGFGGTEPRFTFNTPIVQRDDALKILQNVAGMMRATMLYSGGLIKLNQDRPSSPVKLVTKANVIGGKFTRKSSSLSTRYTAANVTYNDKNDRYLPKVSSQEDVDGITQYGYNSTDIASFGATTEGQAIRQAKWLLDTSLNQTEILTYQSSINQFDLEIGDVIKVYDEDYANHVGSGRIKGVTSTTVVLDRSVTIDASSTIDIQDPSGIGFVTKTITNSPGTYTTLNITPSFSVLPLVKADYIVTSSVQAQLFRVWNLNQTQANLISVEALEYDPAKYNRIELGIDATLSVFTATASQVISNPRNFQANTESVLVDGGVVRGLKISWDAPLTGVPVSYTVKYRYNNGPYSINTGVAGRVFDIRGIDTGKYEITIYSVSITGQQSSGASIVFNADFTSGSGSTLAPVTNLQVQGTTSNTFDGQDLTVEFTNPLSNTASVPLLRDFEIHVYDPTTNALLRTEYVPAVEGGEKQKYTYTFSQNLEDQGPRRSIRIAVYGRDARNKTSIETSNTFTNPAPAALTNLAFVSGIGNVKAAFDHPLELDYKGILIWKGTTSTFTLNQDSCIFEGDATFISLTDVVAGDYFYKAAAYDSFGKSYTGGGLNVSGAISATVMSPDMGVPAGSTLPLTGVEGDSFYNTTNGRLYFYHSGAWVPQGIQTGTTTEMNALTGMVIGDLYSNKTDGLLYRYTATGWVSSIPTTALTGEIVTAQIAAGAVLAGNIATGAVTGTKITDGVVTSLKIADAAVTAAKTSLAAINSLTGNLNANTVNAAQLVAGAVGTLALAANAVTAAKTSISAIDPTTGGLTVGQVNSLQLVEGAVTSLKIADAAVTAAKTSISAIDSTTGNLTANSVNTLQLVNGSVSTLSIAANAVTAAKTAIAAIDSTTGNLTANSVTANSIVAGTITGAEIAAGAITAAKITSGSITALQLAAGTITANEIAALTITGTKIAAGAITAGKIAADAVTATEIAALTITGAEIAAGAITAAKITSGSITALQLAAGTITANEIAALTITGTKIAAGAITAGKIAADAVTATEIAALTITGAEIAAGAITAAKITAGTITSTEIAAGTITASNILGLTITGAQIAAGAITASKITTGSITALQIAAGTITSAEIAAGTIVASDIAAGTITGDRIVAGGITGTQIAADAITSGHIAAGTIVASDIAAGTITGDRLVANTITASNIAVGTISATELAAGSVTAGKIAANAVVTASMAANTISGDRITSNTLTADKIIAGSITSAQIAADGITADKIDTRSLTIKDAAGVVIFSSAANLDYNRVGGTKPPSNATNGATFGTNISGQITAANVSTYIANLAVDTVQIAGNAVTVPAFNTSTITTEGTGFANWIMVAEVWITLNQPGTVFATATGLISYGSGWRQAESKLVISDSATEIMVSNGGGAEAYISISHSGGRACLAGNIVGRLWFKADPGARVVNPSIFIMGAKK